MRRLLCLIIVLITCCFSFAVAQSDSLEIADSAIAINDSTVVDSSSAAAQVDSVELRFGVKLYDTLTELTDSVFEALKSRKFEDLIPFIATTDMIKEEFDSMDLDYMQRLAHVKSQYMINNLRKQHIKMVRYSKKYHLSMRNMVRVNHRIRQKKHEEGHEYGEVILLCEHGRHKFYITFIAIKVVDHWFLADELKMEEIVEPGSGGR